MYSVTTDIEKFLMIIDISGHITHEDLRAIFGELTLKRREFESSHLVLVKLSNITMDEFNFGEIDQQVLTGKVLSLRGAVIWVDKREGDTNFVAEELRKTYEFNKVPCEVVYTREDAYVSLDFID